MMNGEPMKLPTMLAPLLAASMIGGCLGELKSDEPSPSASDAGSVIQRSIRLADIATSVSFEAGGDLWAIDDIGCTGSMKPAFDCGDVLLATYPSRRDLSVGEVVGYTIPRDLEDQCNRSSNTTVIHRITKVFSSDTGELRYNLRGDANTSEDVCTIWFSWVHYRVVAVIHDAKIAR